MIHPRLITSPYQPRPSRTVLGRILQNYRLEHTLSQSALATRLGINHAHVSRIEAGTRSIGTSSIAHWSTVLGIPEVELLLASYGIDPVEFYQHIRMEERNRILDLINNVVERDD